MEFKDRIFSKRGRLARPVNCALFVIHEPARTLGHATSLRGTAAAIITPNGRFWIGVTLCSPLDQFVRATGRAKAIGRAFQAFMRSELLTSDGSLDLGSPQWSNILAIVLRGAIDNMKEEKVAGQFLPTETL